MYYEREIEPSIKGHIQSYFIVFKKQVFVADVFTKFIDSIAKEESKAKLVEKYEIGLSQTLQRTGFSVGSIVSQQEDKTVNNQCFDIINKGFPFLKKSLYS